MASIACTLRSRRTVPFSAFVRARTALGRKPRDENLLSWFSAAYFEFCSFPTTKNSYGIMTLFSVNKNKNEAHNPRTSTAALRSRVTLVRRRDSVRRRENRSSGALPLLACRRDTPLRAKPRVAARTGCARTGTMPAPFGSSARRLQGDVRGSAERAKRPHSASSGGFQPSRKSFFQSLDADERAALLKVAPSLRCARRRRPRARTSAVSRPSVSLSARPARPSRRRVEARHATDPSPTARALHVRPAQSDVPDPRAAGTSRPRP